MGLLKQDVVVFYYAVVSAAAGIVLFAQKLGFFFQHAFALLRFYQGFQPAVLDVGSAEYFLVFHFVVRLIGQNCSNRLLKQDVIVFYHAAVSAATGIVLLA